MLAGGTGGAALAAGISAAGPSHSLTVIANTADDDEFWGLLVCPDVDAVIYRLARLFNERAGYGVRDDTFRLLDALKSAGEDTWFSIGDRDFATHVIRSHLLRQGLSLTAATLELCRRFDLSARVIPMTDQVVRTRFVTDGGELSFQEYFVRRHLKPALRGIRLTGVESARATDEVARTLHDANLVIIGPSNPLISIEPILRLTRDLIVRERTVAVTPIVGGIALKGPTVEMMRATGLDPSPVQVAKIYRDVASTFVLDERDAAQRDEIAALGYRVVVADTVMTDGGRRLARTLLRDV